MLAGFAVALLAVGGFFSFVAALACWSEAVRRLLAGTGHAAGGPRYRGAYLSGEFLKQVFPMKQSGGPAPMAYTISREAGAPYESTLAATALSVQVGDPPSVVPADEPD